VCAASYAGVEASIDAAQAPSFDRKFLFKVLVPGAAQIAQLVGARGPCIQLNAACAGTTQAIAVAQDWLNGSGWGHRSPRVDRVIVVASDNATSASLLPFVGGGFAALGAASTSASPELSAMPFDARRNGMVLGAGAVALVLERSSSSAAAIPRSPTERSKCCLIATQISNSAFHGSRLDAEHIAFEMVRFFADVDAQVRCACARLIHCVVHCFVRLRLRCVRVRVRAPTLVAVGAAVVALSRTLASSLTHAAASRLPSLLSHSPARLLSS
jgi:hypothetical protein